MQSPENIRGATQQRSYLSNIVPRSSLSQIGMTASASAPQISPGKGSPLDNRSPDSQSIIEERVLKDKETGQKTSPPPQPPVMPPTLVMSTMQ